jgi:hypothetical protein
MGDLSRDPRVRGLGFEVHGMETGTYEWQGFVFRV